ncbi:hypothetical protein CDD80_6801 [Ophiocordyceps camponoti-rufipedis]|uniref:Uncharacterized protein n=1 Tax=Ophiocordyceps camponoti-rufipedis TaxID=2004952 RepID=A0A2C5YK50_9HYPO|nr:hypothetical protein CDD80_6801 [Ophiocordyceps camponoti-rufipedis]
MCYREYFVCPECGNSFAERTLRCGEYVNGRKAAEAGRGGAFDWCTYLEPLYKPLPPGDPCPWFCPGSRAKPRGIAPAVEVKKPAESRAQPKITFDPEPDFDCRVRESLNSLSETQHQIWWESKKPRARLHRAKARLGRALVELQVLVVFVCCPFADW